MIEAVHYSFDDVYAASVLYFNGDELAAHVWMSKYALKDNNGNFLEKTPEDMHLRIASELARIEKKYPNPLSEIEIYNLLKDFNHIIPRPLSAIGNIECHTSLSNCFVIGNEGASDSYGGIMKTDQEQVQLMKRLNGVGHDLSHLRPKGSSINNSALTSTGIVPFMERYCNSAHEVSEGHRRSLLLSLSINHPDAEDFVEAKNQNAKISIADLALKVDDDFMKAVVSGNPYVQKYPVYTEDPMITRRVDVHELWNKIIRNTWRNSQPYLLFWDTILRESVTDCYADEGFGTISANPRGEIPLCTYDSCRLLAINIYSYINEPFTKNSSFNFELFKQHARYAQRIADDIIDLSLERIDQIIHKIEEDPEADDIKGAEFQLWKKIHDKGYNGRRTGIGVTGEADTLAALGLHYGSDEALAFSSKLHRELAISTYQSSIQMAEERGAFPLYNAVKETQNPFILRLKEIDPVLYQTMVQHGRRNIACLTIAPTGSLSLMTRTSSGIEPIFSPVYRAHRKAENHDDENADSIEEYIRFHPKFAEWMRITGRDINRNYTEDELSTLIAESPYANATSLDVPYKNKLRLQGEIQRWIDQSINITIHLPENTTEEFMGNVFIDAWRLGCKSCKVYRIGSHSTPVAPVNQPLEKPMPAKRPLELDADVVRFQNNKEKWIAFVGLYGNRPYEIFTGIADDEEGIMLPKAVTSGKIVKHIDAYGNSRYDFCFQNKRGFKTTVEGLSFKFNKEYWNYAKLISCVLRYGMPIQQVIAFVGTIEFDNESINTWKNGVERALKKYISNEGICTNDKCPICSSPLIYQDGILTCKNCGNITEE